MSIRCTREDVEESTRIHVMSSVMPDHGIHDIEALTEEGLNLCRPAGIAIVSISVRRLDVGRWHVRAVLRGGEDVSIEFEVTR